MVVVAWPRVPESKVRNTTFVPPTTAPYWWKNFVEAVPVRICAFHICTRYGGQFFKIVLSMVGAVLTKDRIRMKIHSGKSCRAYKSHKQFAHAIRTRSVQDHVWFIV